MALPVLFQARSAAQAAATSTVRPSAATVIWGDTQTRDRACSLKRSALNTRLSSTICRTTALVACWPA